MGKYLVLVALIMILLIGCSSAIAGKAFSDLSNVQKQFYWKCLDSDGCSNLLKDKQYAAYRSCSLNCNEKASNYSITQGWCKDSDNGADYLTQGIVTTNLDPLGKEDYCYTFPNGKEYLMEGGCQNNGYFYYQKNCAELGAKFKCDSGACFIPNQAPVLNPIGNKEVKEGETLSFGVTAADENNDVLTYSAENLPVGATLEGNVFTWMPSYEQAGIYAVTIKVSDGEFSDEETITVTVSDVILNNAPVLSPIGDQEVNEGETLSFSVSATDEDGDKLVYSAEGLPIGATFENGIFTWTPNYEQAGTYEITFKVSDGWIITSEIITTVVVDSTPKTKWTKTFGGTGDDWAQSVQQTADGGYIIAGVYTQTSKSDGWIIRTDTEGNELWNKTVGNSEEEDGFFSIQPTFDNGFILTGYTNKNNINENTIFQFSRFFGH
ncbi:Ig-like domain-containing protein [Candidatus Woesearchaeota archaeon]|nr:Ig-like domain-containing protein [Candidatus Woesearchaeota archaeon]